MILIRNIHRDISRYNRILFDDKARRTGPPAMAVGRDSGVAARWAVWGSRRGMPRMYTPEDERRAEDHHHPRATLPP